MGMFEVTIAELWKSLDKIDTEVNKLGHILEKHLAPPSNDPERRPEPRPDGTREAVSPATEHMMTILDCANRNLQRLASLSERLDVFFGEDAQTAIPTPRPMTNAEVAALGSITPDDLRARKVFVVPPGAHIIGSDISE